MENEKSKEIFEWIVCMLIALIIVVLIKAFVGFPTVVSGPSMDSTLKDRQRLWVSRIGIEFNKYPKKGDIITFEAPAVREITQVNFDEIYSNKSKGIFEQLKNSINIFSETSFIKRVIGLPGDHIEIKNERVYVNGDPIKENYLDAGTVTDSASGLFTDIVVPDGYVYVLGDKAVFRFWPLKKIGTLK